MLVTAHKSTKFYAGKAFHVLIIFLNTANNKKNTVLASCDKEKDKSYDEVRKHEVLRCCSCSLNLRQEGSVWYIV